MLLNQRTFKKRILNPESSENNSLCEDKLKLYVLKELRVANLQNTTIKFHYFQF